MKKFLKLEEALELLNSLESDESNIEIAVLPDASELTDEDEGDENEINTGVISVKDVPGSLEVFKMSLKKFFKTAEEAVEYLFSEELESVMIALRPEVNELTDEEGFDDTEALDSSVRDVAGSIEISVPYENHDDHREADLSNKSKKRSSSESGSSTCKKGKKRVNSRLEKNSAKL
ncbi:uncharacterized protein TNCV_2838691 [Trichonephila clavipes]|nr:uncharacterized protein TNCV_2838691 [Trichonephila clavipes]